MVSSLLFFVNVHYILF